MLTVVKCDTSNKQDVRRFITIPFRLYKDDPLWVPPLFSDAELPLNRQKHPFYEHSEADFFIAVRDRQDIGRIAVLINHHYIEYHNNKSAQFYFFDCENDLEAATALFNRAFEWARSRGMERIIGPKGFAALDGYGLLQDGFDHRPAMTMMNYNFPYYIDLVEAQGFEKEVDFVSCYLNADMFRLPERVHRIADRVLKRGTLQVQRFTSKNDLKAWAPRIGQTYNNSFVDNWEYVPLTDNEINFVLETILAVADPRLIKIITHKDDAIGFLFGFPDLSTGLQKAKGRLLPFGLFHLLLDMRRTKWIALNGAGILPQYQGRGGNALLYSEMEKTVRGYQFEHADLTQIAESAVQMRRDLVNLGGKPYKNHRVFQLEL